MNNIKSVVLRQGRNTTKQIKVHFETGTAIIRRFGDGYQIATEKANLKPAFAIAEKNKRWLLS